MKPGEYGQGFAGVLLLLVTGTFVAAWCGCPAPQPVAPPPDVVEAGRALDSAYLDPYQAACDAMAHVGCVVLSDCARVMYQANSDPRFLHYDLVCITHALTPDGVRTCGASCPMPDRD